MITIEQLNDSATTKLKIDYVQGIASCVHMQNVHLEEHSQQRFVLLVSQLVSMLYLKRVKFVQSIEDQTTYGQILQQVYHAFPSGQFNVV